MYVPSRGSFQSTFAAAARRRYSGDLFTLGKTYEQHEAWHIVGEDSTSEFFGSLEQDPNGPLCQYLLDPIGYVHLRGQGKRTNEPFSAIAAIRIPRALAPPLNLSLNRWVAGWDQNGAPMRQKLASSIGGAFMTIEVLVAFSEVLSIVSFAGVSWLRRAAE